MSYRYRKGVNLNKMSQRRALLVVFIAIFTDILGFGMIIPLAPILARDFGADGLQVGFLISIYSIFQFIFAPYWGRLSDSFGRKPILLIGLLGVGLAHVWFAFSTSIFHLFVSRALAGFFGGNIVVATAYIADITKPQERSKNLGLIGMAFGLGFTFGPALGFLFILLGRQWGTEAPFGESFAAIGSAIVCLINFVVTSFLLKESLFLRTKQAGSTAGEPPTPSQSYLSAFKKSNQFARPSFRFIWETLRSSQKGLIFLMSFILWISIAQIEPILILLVQDDFHWSKTEAYWGFAYIGFLMTVSQGILVRKFIPRFGERWVNYVGLFFVCLGLFSMGASVFFSMEFLFRNLMLLAGGVTLFSVGYSLSQTSLSGALSLLSPQKEQGSIFGINQSLSSLARILGPLLGGWCYRDLSHAGAFFVAGAMGLAAFLLSLKVGKKFPVTGLLKNQKPESENQDFYSLDLLQLKNLLDKKVPFSFFCLEPSLREEEKPLVSFAEVKTEEELLAFAQEQTKNHPFVLVCREGLVSLEISQKMRRAGYINVYYVKKGFLGLKD